MPDVNAFFGLKKLFDYHSPHQERFLPEMLKVYVRLQNNVDLINLFYSIKKDSCSGEYRPG